MTLCIVITDFDASADDVESEAVIAERQKSTMSAIAILVGLLVMTSLLSCCIKEELRRLNYKKVNQTDIRSDSEF